MTITVRFERLRLTKGTVVFKEVLETTTPYIGTLYVRKDTFERGKYPERLTAVVSWEEQHAET